MSEPIKPLDLGTAEEQRAQFLRAMAEALKDVSTETLAKTFTACGDINAFLHALPEMDDRLTKMWVTQYERNLESLQDDVVTLISLLAIEKAARASAKKQPRAAKLRKQRPQ